MGTGFWKQQFATVGPVALGLGLSDPRAALVAGVNVDRILIGVFALSGVLTALAGGLLSYSRLGT